MPTATDLVTDLPADFEVFGQAVATSMADLLGGTSGQVLAKNSNTDMDFVWVAQDDSNAIQNTIVDAKGDLIAASAADTPARLAVGSNGETLVADSSTSTGLRYQGHIEAGKNFLINGGFDIWQRGTSSTASNYGTADRWYSLIESGSGTWAQETTVVPTGATYSLKFTASATSSVYPIQAIESLNATRLAGQRVTFSGLVAASTSTAMSMIVSHSSSVDVAPAGSWTNLTAVSGGTATPTSTTFVPISGVYDIPSTAKSIRVLIRTTSTIASSVVVYWGNQQLEIGSVPTTFSRAGGNIQGELDACKRYYRKSYNQGTAPATASVSAGIEFAQGYAALGSAEPIKSVSLNPTMRTAPTVTVYGFAGGSGKVSTNGGTDLAASSGLTQYGGDASFTVSNQSGGSITPNAGGFIFHYVASAEL